MNFSLYSIIIHSLRIPFISKKMDFIKHLQMVVKLLINKERNELI